SRMADFRCGTRTFPHEVRAIPMPWAGGAEPIESKRLLAKGTRWRAWLTSAVGTKVSRCRTLGASWQPGRARTRERAMRLHDEWKFPERFDGNQKRQAGGAR